MLKIPRITLAATRTEKIIMILIIVVLAIGGFVNWERRQASCQVGFTKVIVYSSNELICVRGIQQPVIWDN